MTNTDLSVYDNYEISPCRRYEEPDSPGRFYFEVCEPDKADVWTLYGHITGEGVEAIGDFRSQDAAETIYFRITGVKFSGSYTADAHLRVMHAGPKLLEALMAASDWIDLQIGRRRTDIQSKVQQAIAEATGRTSHSLTPRPRESHDSRRKHTERASADKRQDWEVVIRRIENRSLTHNDRRAMRVEHVLTWCKDWDTGREGLIDLLTDARHWCDRHGGSFAVLDRLAYQHYIAELNEPSTNEE